MKILHYYASSEVPLVIQYVKTLCEAMGTEVTNEVTTNGTDAKERLTAVTTTYCTYMVVGSMLHTDWLA